MIVAGVLTRLTLTDQQDDGREPRDRVRSGVARCTVAITVGVPQRAATRVPNRAHLDRGARLCAVAPSYQASDRAYHAHGSAVPCSLLVF